MEYAWVLALSSVKSNDNMIKSLNNEIANGNLSDEEKESALETIQDLENQNVSN